MNITPDMWPADTEALRARITRLEAQSEVRRLQVAYWEERARTLAHDVDRAEARIQAVRDVLDKHAVDYGGEPLALPVPQHAIRRALDVSPD